MFQTSHHNHQPMTSDPHPMNQPPPPPPPSPQPSPPNSFELVLREMRHGRSLAELSQELAALVAAVRETGKGGSLSYTITVKPASQGDVVTVQLQDEVKAKVPKPARGASIFYASDENALMRSDPRQREFALREVPKAPAPEVRELPQTKVS